MKISTFMILLLIVSALIFSFAYMINDAKNYYPSSEVNISSWENNYDYYNSINNSIGDIQKPLKNLADEDKGWMLKTIQGVAAMPRAFIALVSVVINSFVLGSSLISGTFISLGLPPYLIAIVLVMVLVWGIIKLIESIQRWPL